MKVVGKIEVEAAENSLGKLGFEIPEWCFLGQALRWVAERTPIVDDPSIYFSFLSPADADLETENYKKAKKFLQLALASGKLPARGLVFHFEVEESEGMPFVKEVLEESIEPDFWYEEPVILWEADCVRPLHLDAPAELLDEAEDYELASEDSESGYEQVSVPTDALFKLTGGPEQGEESEKKIRMALARNRAGAPETFSWAGFYLQIALIAHSRVGGLPADPSELTRIMREWCAENWNGKIPSRTSLHHKINVAIYGNCHFKFSKVDWGDFYCEIAIMMARDPDGLPTDREKLVGRMVTWCKSQWGGVSANMVRQRIDALYDRAGERRE